MGHFVFPPYRCVLRKSPSTSGDPGTHHDSIKTRSRLFCLLIQSNSLIVNTNCIHLIIYLSSVTLSHAFASLHPVVVVAFRFHLKCRPSE